MKALDLPAAIEPDVMIMEYRIPAMYFNEDQTACLDALTRRIQQHTGIRLTTAVVDRSGSYPEIPWKAFAFMVCTHAVLHLLQGLFHQDRLITWGVQNTVGFIVGTSALVALLSLSWPAFGGIFLAGSHAEKTVRRFAESMVARQGIFDTPERNGLLLLVSLFERQVVLVSDNGLAARLDANMQRQVADEMVPHLRRQDPFQALEKGLRALASALPVFSPEPALPQESAAQAFIQCKGADA
jgi:putative membrane protein